MIVQPGGSGGPGQPAQSGQRCVIVAGDLTIDWHITRPGPLAESDAWNPRVNARARGHAGGAMLVADVLRALPYADWIVAAQIDVPHVLASDDRRLYHSYAIWSPHPRRRGSRETAWRVAEFLGLDPASPDAVAVAKTPDDGAPTSDLVILDDAALGFRDDPARWPAALKTADHRPWIILKMARPVAAGPLWDELVCRHADRLIVVLTANDLRETEIQVSRELSWERTAQDLYRELVENAGINSLARCAHVVVSFGPDGALHLTRNAGRTSATLYFDPVGIEGAWRVDYPGRMIGYTTCLVGGLARQVMLAPATPDIGAGIVRGVAAARDLHLGGYDPGRGDGPELSFPAARIAQVLTADPKPGDRAVVSLAPVRYPSGTGFTLRSGRAWTILEDRYTTGLEDLAAQIVLLGPKRALAEVPLGEFGKLLTVDRREIESFRALRGLVLEYAGQCTERPLSVAVFGAPGAGKSFAIKQIATALLPGQVEELTVNLSQLDGLEGLHDAFHRVRDAGLKGKLPLVFWDEFDTTYGRDRLGWLRHFLAPMQDGEFQHGQLNHPIGRAIFVFAGGTCRSMSQFTADLESEAARAVKLPDFVSRLRGFIDILGPNPEGSVAADPYYVLRRAIVLRAAFERLAPHLIRNVGDESRLRIDRGVLQALLRTRTYHHGARSIEAVLGTSRLSDNSQFERSCLPPESQLALHVDTADFAAILRGSGLSEQIVDRLARGVHQAYCDGLEARGYVWGPKTSDDARTSSMLVPFEQLPPHEQEQNRANARHIILKLAEVGYAVIRACPGDPLVVLSESVVERLSELEHARWTRAKLADGWRCGPERDDAARTHPAMLPWAEPPEQAGALYPFTPDELERLCPTALPEDQKEKDRILTRAIPTILRAAGLTLVPIDPEV